MATCIVKCFATNSIGKLQCNFAQHLIKCLPITFRGIHVSPILDKRQAGKYKVTIRHDKPLTYEQSNPPQHIGHRKSWNSWNTSSLVEEKRSSETAVEDMFIRKFMFGTWHRLFLSEVIIKRRHNMIFIAGIINRVLHTRKIYFLIGYTEEMLQCYLKCIVKLEIQTTAQREDVIFKYI